MLHWLKLSLLFGASCLAHGMETATAGGASFFCVVHAAGARTVREPGSLRATSARAVLKPCFIETTRARAVCELRAAASVAWRVEALARFLWQRCTTCAQWLLSISSECPRFGSRGNKLWDIIRIAFLDDFQLTVDDLIFQQSNFSPGFQK